MASLVPVGEGLLGISATIRALAQSLKPQREGQSVGIAQARKMMLVGFCARG